MSVQATPASCKHFKEGDTTQISIPEIGITIAARRTYIRGTNVLPKGDGCAVDAAVAALKKAGNLITREMVWRLHSSCNICHRDVSFDLA